MVDFEVNSIVLLDSFAKKYNHILERISVVTIPIINRLVDPINRNRNLHI